MTLEEHLKIVIDKFVMVYPDVAPMNAALPYCTYQLIGGRPVVFVDNTIPDKKHAYVQMNVFAKSAIEASNFIAQIERELLASSRLQASPINNAQSVISDDPEAKIKGRMQDFSIWYPTN